MIFKVLKSRLFLHKQDLQKWHLPSIFYSTNITAVKMDFSAHESTETDQNATPIIIMHGLFGSKQNFRSVSRALESKLKSKIFAVDARNHGESPHTDEHSSAHMAADVLELMRSQNLAGAHLIGHSMGGRTMMRFALEFPQLVAKLVVLDISPISMPHHFSEMETIFTAMRNIEIPSNLTLAQGRALGTTQLKKFKIDLGTINFIMLNLRKKDTGEFYWTVNVDALDNSINISSDYKSHIGIFPPFKGKTMFICGKNSDYMNPADWPEIRKIFPNSELHWLDAGHLVHVDQPARVIELVVNFLK